MKGIAEVVVLNMGETFLENDLFKDFGQKWKVRNGIQITWYNASGKRCVADVRDGRQEDVNVFIKKRGGNGNPVHKTWQIHC